MRFTEEDKKKLAMLQSRARDKREPDYSAKVRKLVKGNGLTYQEAAWAITLAYGQWVPWQSLKNWCADPAVGKAGGWRPAPRWAWLWLRFALERR